MKVWETGRADGVETRESSPYRAIESTRERSGVMDELADVNLMHELIKGGNEASQIEQLLNEFELHEAKEERFLEDYRNALREVKNPANRFVLQMIVADEEKHRAVSHALVATLKGSLTWRSEERRVGKECRSRWS